MEVAALGLGVLRRSSWLHRKFTAVSLTGCWKSSSTYFFQWKSE